MRHFRGVFVSPRHGVFSWLYSVENVPGWFKIIRSSSVTAQTAEKYTMPTLPTRNIDYTTTHGLPLVPQTTTFHHAVPSQYSRLHQAPEGLQIRYSGGRRALVRRRAVPGLACLLLLSRGTRSRTHFFALPADYPPVLRASLV